jgi:hypothetical protein
MSGDLLFEFGIQRRFANEGMNAAQGAPQGAHEYGGLWLNRDGTPTTLSKGIYEYLMDPSATTAQRRDLYARDMAALTEFFRVHRKAAGILEFSGLDYSRPDGQTSDDFVDIEKLTHGASFDRYVRDAFAPVGLMVDSWAEEYPAGSRQKFPILLVNDLEDDWKGDIRFRLLEGTKVLTEKILPATIAAFGTGRVTFSITVPIAPSSYRGEATLLKTPDGPVSSERDFDVLTPEQREARRNLAKGQPAKASSEQSEATRADYAVDGNGDTEWTPIGGGPQWIAVDLGQSKRVSRVLVDWDWRAYPKAFLIEASSDEKKWSQVASVQKSDGPIQMVRFSPVQARFIHILIPATDAIPIYSLPELEVYR